ncbi:MAG: signal peptidase II [Novosphingobium sp.]
MNVWLRRLSGFALAGLLLEIDQAIKLHLYWHSSIKRAPIELLPFFRLSYVENYGVSLGLLTADSSEMRWLLVGFTSLIALGVAVWILRERKMPDILALALVLGGAAGNIRDRSDRGFVMDYADLHFGDFRPFLVFNLADAAITVGVVILLARSLLSRDKPTPAPDPAAET